MPRKRLYIVLLLAIAAGTVFALGTYRYVEARPERPIGVESTPVVVAAVNLDVGAALRAEDLRVIEWPAGSVPSGAFSKRDELIGRGVIQPMAPSEAILPSKLASKDAGAGLPPIIPEGMRALSVRVNDVIGVAGYVLPGTKVDVLVTVSPTDQHADITSKVILTNVQVLAAGTRIERDTEKDKPIAVSVVTLLVDPAQSERLTLASTEGKIQLALRNPLDQTMPPTPGIRPAVLLGASAARPAARRAAAAPLSVAAASVPPAPTVEIIRGDKRAQEVVRQE
jgi:pilus assembly protein CpaB